MADRPILFSSPMVRALLDGRKTQTRRIIKPQPPEIVTSAGVMSRSNEGQTDEWSWLSGDPRDIDTWGCEGEFKTRFRPGDLLYVREHWRTREAYDALAPHKLVGDEPIFYIADRHISGLPSGDRTSLFGKHRQAMHMPRWASRLTLTVTDVRVQRLQDISEEDAIAEGIYRVDGFTMRNGSDHADWSWQSEDCSFDLNGSNAREGYERLWNSINGTGSWEANPWVVAVSFSVERRNIDA